MPVDLDEIFHPVRGIKHPRVLGAPKVFSHGRLSSTGEIQSHRRHFMTTKKKIMSREEIHEEIHEGHLLPTNATPEDVAAVSALEVAPSTNTSVH